MWLETGVSGFSRLEDPKSVMEGGDLARLWKGGKTGTVSPLMQAKAWGLSEAGVQQVDIAAELEKIGGGHPTKSAVCKLGETCAASAPGAAGEGGELRGERTGSGRGAAGDCAGAARPTSAGWRPCVEMSRVHNLRKRSCSTLRRCQSWL